jgi:hypothetical protein
LKLKNLKELERVMKLCRANGIPEITIDGVCMKFDELKPNAQPETEFVDMAAGLTDEQLATWSGDGN